MRKNGLFHQLKSLTTEQRNKQSLRIDSLEVVDILRLINQEDKIIADAVRVEVPHIAKAVNFVVEVLKNNGRLIYIGAGTSGRLGILDASECPPTFGTNPAAILGIIAGGRKAVFRSQEGAEDRELDGSKDIRKLKVTKKDIVCGIAASMRTPYVTGALREAKKRSARTILVTTNSRTKFRERQFAGLRRLVDVAICPVVGPEIIMGSTRMKSGTAQKLVLNMLTTAAMIRLGKVYENMMVDLRMNSRKLEERAKRVLMVATGVDYSTASHILNAAGDHVKTAIVMIKTSSTKSQAQHRLKKANGFVRDAIKRE